MKINSLIETNKNLEQLLEKYKDLKALPHARNIPFTSPLADSQPDQLVTPISLATCSNASDVITTPVNSRTLDKELAIFDDIEYETQEDSFDEAGSCISEHSPNIDEYIQSSKSREVFRPYDKQLEKVFEI